MGALAEFGRALIVERTARIAAARKRGQHLGPRRPLSAAQVAHARAMIAEGKETTASMAALLGVGRATLWRALKD